jgi:hypothetical protein
MGFQPETWAHRAGGVDMIYAASYCYPEHHHGFLVPLTHRYPYRVWRETPTEEERHKRPIIEQGRRLDPKRAIAVKFLAPTKELAALYKSEGEAAFIEGYRLQIKANYYAIRAYLESRDPAIDETWLSNGAPGVFSHRNLALKLVEKYRTDCYGGADVPIFLQTDLLESNHEDF